MRTSTAVAGLLVSSLAVSPAPARIDPVAPDAEAQTGPEAQTEELSRADATAKGAMALERGDAAGAREAFEMAIAAENDNATAWLGLSAANELAGDWPRALQAARRAAALAPEQAQTEFTLARLLGRAGDVAGALAAFERVRELAPEIEEAYLLPALLLRDEDRQTEALALLEVGWQRAPTPRMAEQLAFLALSAGEAGRALEVVDEALASLELAEEASPGQAPPGQTPPGQTSRAGDLQLAKALALAAESDRRIEAAEWFGEALAAGVSREGPARLEWARLLSELERWPAAAEQLEVASRLLPETPEVFFRLAAARRQTGDDDGARAALERYQELNEAVVAAERRERTLGTALNEAQELASDNRLGEALARLDAVEEGSADPRVLVLRGKVLLSLGRADEAFEAVRAARNLAPTDIEPVYLTALFAFRVGRYADSIAAVEQTLALDPSLGEAWALYGSALARSARLEEAASSFERALVLGFDSAALRLDYAGVLSDLGRPEESRAQLEARERLTEG